MKNSFITALVLSVVAAVSPATAFGMDAANPAHGVLTTPKTSSFCANLPAKVTALQDRLAKEQTERQANQSKEDAGLKQYRLDVDQKLVTRRTGWDTERAAAFSKLEAKPGHFSATAISTYEASIRAAVSAKHSSNDAATSTYRTAKDQDIAARRSAVQQALITRNNSVSSAYQSAQASCTSGSTADSVRSTLQASVKAAQATFKNADSAAFASLKAQVQTSYGARKATEAKDYSLYKAAVDAARQTLKASPPL